MFGADHIHDGINSTLVILGNRLKAQPHRPEIQIDKDYGELPLVECYAGQLNQVFMNILSNGIDALESHLETYPEEEVWNWQPKISITTYPIDHDQIGIEISDNGPGIPKDIQTKIFDPFFTTKPVGKGTGLGMSISYEIITRKHQGSIRLDSEMGDGANFVIAIPVALQPQPSKKKTGLFDPVRV